MIRRHACLCVLPLFVSLAWADQVLLKNGDRVTGKVQKKQGASLVVNSEVFGPVSIPWDAVTRISTEEPVTVVLPEGKSVLGKVTTEESALVVTTQATRESVALAQVTAIRNADEQKAFERLEHPGWLALWIGYADLGWSLAYGNSESNMLATAVKAGRETKADRTSLYFTQIFAKGEVSDGTTATTAQAVRGGWAYNRNAASRAFFNVFNDYEYDAFQNLDLRFVAGGGLGYHAFKKERGQMDLVAGGAYAREKFSTPLTRDSGELYWGNNLLYKFSRITTFNQTFRMFNNLTATGEYRMNFDVGQSTQINRWLSWQLTFSDRYLSNPVQGLKKNDLLFSTGVRFNFAR